MADGGAKMEDPPLNRTQLAQIFNVSENTIDKWRKKGMPVVTEGGNGTAYEFSFADCEAWLEAEKENAAREKQRADDFVAQQRMKFLGLKSDDRKAGMSPAQMRELAQAELAWMQAAKQRKSLVAVDEMVDLLDAIFTEIRAALDGQPDWLEREFDLTGPQVERIVTYNDGILKMMTDRISAAQLGEAGDEISDGPML